MSKTAPPLPAKGGSYTRDAKGKLSLADTAPAKKPAAAKAAKSEEA